MTTKTELTKQQNIANLIKAELAEHGLEGVAVRATDKGYMEKISINPVDKSPSDIKTIETIADKYRLAEDEEDSELKIRFIFVSANYTDGMRQKALDALTDANDLAKVDATQAPTFMTVQGESVNVKKTISDILRGLNDSVDIWNETEVDA